MGDRSRLVPAQEYSFPTSQGSVGVTTFYRDFNFSLSQLRESEELRLAIQHILDTNDLDFAFAPKPGFNARMVDPTKLYDEVSLPRLKLLRSEEKADGMLLPEGTAMLMSLGGCGIVILHSRTNGRNAVLHCAQRSLINLEPDKPRQHESIINAGLEALESDSRDVCVFGMNFIPAESHFHPYGHAEFDNVWLRDTLYAVGSGIVTETQQNGTWGITVNLEALAIRQLLDAKVPRQQIRQFVPMSRDLPHTHLPRDDRRREHTYLVLIHAKRA